MENVIETVGHEADRAPSVVAAARANLERMDPTQALADALWALRKANLGAPESDAVGDAIDSLEALVGWLETDGFPPDVDQALARMRRAEEQWR